MLAFGALLCAQQPDATPTLSDAQRIRQQLASALPADVAWGTRFVQMARAKEFAGDLQRALQHWRTSDDADRMKVCMHLLDALVAIDARLPGHMLLDLVDDRECGAAAFALLAREPNVNEPELLTLFRRDWPAFDVQLATQRDRRTLAIGNALAAQRAAGFAAVIAPSLEVTMAVAPGTERSTYWIRQQQGRSMTQDDLVQDMAPPSETKPGWPPAFRYQIGHRDWLGNAPTAPLPREFATTVHRLVDDGAPRNLSRRRGGAEAPDTLRWLITMAGMQTLTPSLVLRVDGDGSADERQRIRRHRDSVQTFLVQLRAQLVVDELLDPEVRAPFTRPVTVVEWERTK